MKPAILETHPPAQSLGDLWPSDKTNQASGSGFRFNGLLTFILAGAIFLLDRMVSDSLPVYGLYAGVLYLTTRLGRPRYFWIGVCGCTGLIVLDLMLAMQSPDHDTFVLNAGMGLLTLWIVAWIVWDHSREKSNWREQEQQFEDTLQELTRQLGVARVKVESSLLKRQETEQALANLNHTLSQQNRELETILSVASHDLRSPLVNVQGFGRELARACATLRAICIQEDSSGGKKQEMLTIVEQDIPEALHYIQAGAKKMETLLQGVLRLAGLGRLTLRYEQLDMNAMIAGILAGMEYQLKEKEVALQIDDLPPCLGDATLINQLFCNLLDNAHKFLDPSRIGIIQIGGVRDGEWARYTIKDNGLGIHKEHQDKIFQMFHRLNPSETSGDGLGLTIVKRIVDRHHGAIKIESFPGTGTTFTVSLPAG